MSQCKRNWTSAIYSVAFACAIADARVILVVTQPSNQLSVQTTGSRGALFDRTRRYFPRIVAVDLKVKLIALHKICTAGQITTGSKAAKSVYIDKHKTVAHQLNNCTKYHRLRYNKVPETERASSSVMLVFSARCLFWELSRSIIRSLESSSIWKQTNFILMCCNFAGSSTFLKNYVACASRGRRSKYLHFLPLLHFHL